MDRQQTDDWSTLGHQELLLLREVKKKNKKKNKTWQYLAHHIKTLTWNFNILSTLPPMPGAVQ